MDADVQELIQQIHAAPRKTALVLTGGGATAAAWLLAVPGGSRTVLEVAVPYAQEALVEYLGREPISSCSASTARSMALRARERAARLAPGESVVGLACTASLRSDRPKRGDHRVHVAAAMDAKTVVLSLTLAKEQRDRQGEEAVVSRLILNTLAEAFSTLPRLTLPLLPGEVVTREEESAGLLARFLIGEVSTVCVEPDGLLRCDSPIPSLLLPGSFNPLHEGHRGMAAAAAHPAVSGVLTTSPNGGYSRREGHGAGRQAGKSAAFELSVANVEKPSLGEGEVRRRMAPFAWYAPLWLTRAPTFIEKARLFPGVMFVVGVDTAVRIVQPRFYGDSVEAMRAALDEIRRHGCRFLVAGRLIEGSFVELEKVDIPLEFRDLFKSVSQEVFRVDVSSTQLRAAPGGMRDEG